jgi:uncharacterized peroxidase-related enzyme
MMAWIQTVEPEQASGELREGYDRLGAERGKLSNIMKVQSLHPAAMGAHLDLYLAVMFGRSEVSREERELIAVVVSAANGCRYCVSHHAAALMFYWRDAERVRAAEEDFRALDLPDRARSMLEYADLLTRNPSAVTEKEVSAMRSVGLSDGDVLTVNLVVSYFNFVNRIAEGLGVEVSEEEVAGYRY